MLLDAVLDVFCITRIILNGFVIFLTPYGDVVIHFNGHASFTLMGVL
jgi:hypothetical protein